MKRKSLDFKINEMRARNSFKKQKEIELHKRKLKVKRELAKVDHEHTLHRIILRELGSIKKFIEYLSHCTPDADGDIGRIIKKWNFHGPRRMTIDEIINELQLDAGRVYGWASEGAYRFMHHTKNFKLAEAMPGVLERNAKEAIKAGGFKDRDLFASMAGFLPKGSGTQVNVNQVNENTAQAAADAKIQKLAVQLPSFDADTVASCDDMRK